MRGIAPTDCVPWDIMNIESRWVMMRWWCCGVLMSFVVGCETPMRAGDVNEAGMKTYRVKRLSAPIKVDADWAKAVWRDAEAIVLANHMGPRPEHFPKTQAKLAYDDESLYVIFRVEDRYVRAVAEKHQDSVCVDSCVEFFFTPRTDPENAGYFNLEMNCGGTMLFNYQLIPWKNRKPVSEADLARIETATTLPKRVEPEVTAPTTWVVEYRLPFDLLSNYIDEWTQPAPGVEWRANVYKCADATSHPHWLTWSPVDHPRPNFHLPQYFGRLLFE